MIILIIIGIIVVLMVGAYIFPVQTRIKAMFNGVPTNIFELMFMRFRRVDPDIIVDQLIATKHSGLHITPNELESHLLAGGNIATVIQAIIQAKQAKIPLSFEKACAIDLAGRDVLDAVNMCVNPKVIKTPLIGGVAKDGIQIKAMVRITVKADINKLIGGAGEATVIARVAEGICSTIGSAESHKTVLKSPMLISDTVQKKGLDTGTAFTILSIDIADVDVGKNIGSELQIQQAEADKNIAQSKSEQRKSLAVAEEQEMQAKVIEMQAKVIASEAEVPLALANALRAGV